MKTQWLQEYKSVLAEKRIKLLSTLVRDPERGNRPYGLHKCLVCKHEWDGHAFNIKNAPDGCPECGKQRVAQKRFEKHRASFDARLNSKNDKLLRIGEYLGGHVEIKFKCTSCRKSFLKAPSILLQNPRCPKCYVKKAKGLLDSAFLKFEIACSKRKYKILEYKGTACKAKLKCKCGNMWSTFPHSITQGSGCPHCAIAKSYSCKTVCLDKVTFKVQGFEDIALHYMVRAKGVKTSSIHYGRKDIPVFQYTQYSKQHKYHPDFRIGKRIVEVKSLWTAGWTNTKVFKNLQVKAQSVLDQNYKFSLLLIKIVRGKFYVAIMPSNWVQLSLKEVKPKVKWVDISKHIPKALAERKRNG